MSVIADNGSENVSHEFSDELSTQKKTNEKDNDCNEFDLVFSEKQKRLKPSKIQQNADNKINDNSCNITSKKKDRNDENDENDGIAIQSEILSHYLKPTNILSKYQNCSSPNKYEQYEEFEEEEKEWPTNEKLEMEFNVKAESESENENWNSNEFEEKSDLDIVLFNDLYAYLIEEANNKIDFDDIIIFDFRNVSWFDYIKMYIFNSCAITLKTQKLIDERDSVFKIAKLKLDLTNIFHNRMLQTVWMKLTNDPRQCDKTGSHWQQIGFQGNNPQTDIRGCGLFGILQLIYIIENYNDIICKIYLLSINKYQNFPLICVSFTISTIIIRLLRSCLIYNYINNKNSTLCNSINELYVALFYQFYLHWKNNSKTIINFDNAQKELEIQAFSNWNGLIQQLIKRTNEIYIQTNNNNNQQQQQLIPDTL